MKISQLFCEFLCLFYILKIVYCIRIYTHIVVTTLIEAGFTGWVQWVLSGWVSWLLELVQVLLNVTLVLCCVHWLRHELTHEVCHLPHWHSTDFICTWFVWIDHFLCFLLRKGSLLFKYLVLLNLFICLWFFCLELAHQLAHQISGTFWRLFDFFFLFIFLVFIVFWLLNITLLFNFRGWTLWGFWWLYDRWGGSLRLGLIVTWRLVV